MTARLRWSSAVDPRSGSGVYFGNLKSLQQTGCVASPNAKTLIEYRAVALELVRKHPWLTETRSCQRPR